MEVWWPIIDRVAQEVQLNQALLEAVMHEESGGDPDAFPEHPERDGASFGLMQLLLPTARAVGFSGKAPQLFSADMNITLAARYLAGLVREYRDTATALVAYNGGPGAAWRYAHHLPAGPAAQYSRVVMALYGLYHNRNLLRGHDV